MRQGWARGTKLAALGLVVLTAACGAVAEPVLPTLRPTFTPSPELSATPTRIFNATPTPIRAQAPTTPTAGPSPTPLMGPIPTQPPFTTAATQGVVVGDLQIEYFTTSASSLRPGDRLTLFWSTKGVDKATIYRLDAKGKRGQLWNVNRAGSLEVATKPDDRDVVQFLLTIGDATNHLDQTLAVPLSCSEPWFFEPQPSQCAPSPAIVSAEVEQTFERGLMIWVQAQTRVYVLFNDNQKPLWAYYPDEFKDGQPESDPSLSPPSGLFQPIRGFGLVWRTRERVRERLGWATSVEFPFDGMLQGDATLEGGVMYLRAKNGNILELSDKGASWKLITP
jgi:hypothetical protein